MPSRVTENWFLSEIVKARLFTWPAVSTVHLHGKSGDSSIEAGPFELTANKPLRLRVFVDKSVVEVFANGRQAAMRRIYPSRKDSVSVAIFSKAGAASVPTL